MIDVVCFGELLVDFLPDRRGRLREAERFHVRPGGAPANVAVGLSRLGVRTAFVGVVGDDEFGRSLERQMQREGVETALRFTRTAATGLSFIALDEHGDRSFFAPTAASADKLLDQSDVARIPPSRWLHCGSSAHITRTAQDALRAAVRLGRNVSFDPNVRAHLWDEPRDVRRLCEDVFPHCTIVKLSEDELEACAGVETPEAALDALREVELVCVTLGPRGVVARRRGGETLHVPAPRVDVVDTTGAGDGFVAGLLSKDPLAGDLGGALRFACAVGSRVCTRLGAVAGLPTRAEADAF
jgi:fructokinase